MLALGCAGFAHAEIIPPDPWGTQIGYPCVVLCETLTLREGPSASSKAIQTLHYGDHLSVQPADASAWKTENNGFVYCILGELEGSPCGWADSDYILFNPAWYVTETETPVYAWNDPSAPKVALLDKSEASHFKRRGRVVYCQPARRDRMDSKVILGVYALAG